MNPASTPWYSHRWPWLLMAGPAIVLLACFYTSYIAFSQQDALVVGDYYKRGKAINQDLRRDRMASALGLSAELRYDAARGALQGRVISRTALPPGALALHLAHATQPEHDVRLTVQPDAEGRFTAPLPMLERSRWVVLVEGGQRSWRLEGSWQWPMEREVTLRAD
ncbi:FixH family protein [Massilia endophytica]|uniref:FixH family protein n=1 Tax=Massilia endophytica TaxID=2899220 RepID=UPI001E4668DD|nr:FixH family protein [Massilia endophytica]UGQ46430.1 FixH family protein [Massilia endophytica]